MGLQNDQEIWLSVYMRELRHGAHGVGAVAIANKRCPGISQANQDKLLLALEHSEVRCIRDYQERIEKAVTVSQVGKTEVVKDALSK